MYGTAAHPPSRAAGAGIRAVERAAAILKAFSPTTPALGVSELSRRLGLHKSTVHRLLTTLEHEGFVVKDAGSGRYRLGLQLFELGSLVVNSMELQKIARSYLEDAHRACAETLHLAVLDEGEVVYIDKIESTRQLRMHSLIRRRTAPGSAKRSWPGCRPTRWIGSSVGGCAPTRTERLPLPAPCALISRWCVSAGTRSMTGSTRS